MLVQRLVIVSAEHVTMVLFDSLGKLLVLNSKALLRSLLLYHAAWDVNRRT